MRAIHPENVTSKSVAVMVCPVKHCDHRGDRKDNFKRHLRTQHGIGGIEADQIIKSCAVWSSQV